MAIQTKQASKIKKPAKEAPRQLSNGHVITKKRLTIDPKNLEAIKFLDSMDNATPEEIQEQKETWAFLKKALNEDRPSSGRPLFPDELEGEDAI